MQRTLIMNQNLGDSQSITKPQLKIKKKTKNLKSKHNFFQMGFQLITPIYSNGQIKHKIIHNQPPKKRGINRKEKKNCTRAERLRIHRRELAKRKINTEKQEVRA